VAPTVALVRKSYQRGRGPQRIRAIVSVTFDAQHAGAYEALKGFLDAAGGEGVDVQSVIFEPIMNIAVANAGYGVVGSVIEPRLSLLSQWTGFTHNLLGTHGILDFYKIESNNYAAGGGPYKRVYVRIYGLKAGPLFEEASTDAALTGGEFLVELEYTPISGAEA
jgi:hypothetical protein